MVGIVVNRSLVLALWIRYVPVMLHLRINPDLRLRATVVAARVKKGAANHDGMTPGFMQCHDTP